MPEDAPDTGEILVECTATALVLRIHNPGRANALTPAMLASLGRLASDPPGDVRSLVLTGSGERHFCSGLDLSGARGEELQARLREGEGLLRRATAALAECRLPVVAAVNGAAFGGGLELAVACDWRVAAASARLGMPAARLGVVYAPEGLLRFIDCMGPARARMLFLTGRPVTADRARELGLVDEVVPAGELEARVAETSADIALAGPGAVAATRSAITLLHAAPMPEAAQDVERLRAAAYASPEFAEGLEAAAERRPPRWAP
ncbi:MAG: enoyl-CoA hydratase/isomerase family protein [Thermoleophilia bacterium]|nr:enoyl-CoA hydratase/isomerase family protein [Thermoleophilia bacterium]